MKTSEEISLLGGRILVVDDEEKNRRYLTDMLSAEGYTVRTVNDGLEALQLAPEFQPEAILLDIMMPNLDGVETCRRLKADPSTGSIPILLATALRERADRLRGLKAGANDFLTKPLDTEEVRVRVKNAVHSKRLHDDLQQAYLDLQTLEKLRDNLIHMMVHDLRSPLMVMSLSFEMVLPEIKRLCPEQHDIMSMSQGSCRSMIEMVSAMLDVSRMEEGKLPLTRASCDVREIARAAAESMMTSARERNLALRITGDSTACNADREIIRRVFVNLLGNAIKFSPADGRIGIEVSLKGQVVRCAVTDSGYGIPPAYHERIFEKFGQVETRKAGKTYSTGLGLTFCKMAVEAHGGKIGVVSEVGRGSTFWFELPA